MDRPLPVIFSYCATFLPREMLHVFRQVAGIQRFENHVLTRTRANADRFPFPRVHVLRKSPLRFLTRLLHRAQGNIVPVARSEINQMLRLFEGHKAILAHAYLGTEARRILPFLEEAHCARIVSFHGADLANAQGPDFYRPLWPVAELVLCRSKSLKAELVAKGCPEERIRLNYTGVPIAPYVPREMPRPSSHRPLRILQVCRLIEKKGLDVTLQAVARLHSQGLPVRVTLAGDGPLRPDLERQALELGIRDHVTFAGFLNEEQVRQLFRESDVFVHPSRATPVGDREGIPNSLLEAMAAGLPVVSTRHSGIPEAVEDGVSGLLLEHADPDALAAAISRLISSPEFYGRISTGGWERVYDRFSVECCIAALEGFYAEAIELRRTS